MDVLYICNELSKYNGIVYTPQTYNIIQIDNRYKSILNRNLNLDLLPKSMDFIKARFNYKIRMDNKYNVYEPMVRLQNYFYDYRLVENDFPNKEDVLKYKKYTQLILKQIVYNHLLNFSLKISSNKEGCLDKTMYIIALNLFSIMEDTTLISDEHMNICKKIHAGNMSKTYLKDLACMIMDL